MIIMPEKELNGVKVVELAKYSHDVSVLRNRMKLLSRKIVKLRGQYKADMTALNVMKTLHFNEYWDVVSRLTKEYAAVGRVISEPDGLRKVLQKTLERDGYRCVRCGMFGVTIDPQGHAVRFDLTNDHIHEKADGGISDISNFQTLCKWCHKLKSRLTVTIRNEVEIDCRKALLINERFLRSWESLENYGMLRAGLLSTFASEKYKTGDKSG